MSAPATRRSMVRALRQRVLLVVAVAVVLLGVASVWGLRIVTDRNAERQVQIAAQAVTTWGADVEGGVRVIDSGHLAAVDAASTVVALLTDDGRVIVASSRLPVTVSMLEQISGSLEPGETERADANSQTILFTEVPLPGDVLYDDGTRTPVDRALVGIGVEGSDRLVAALAVAAAVLVALVLALVAVVVTLVVSRTTRSLTDLSDRVERGALDGLSESPAAEFAETGAIAGAIARLDQRRDATERQLRDFVADASHELRTPLTKIQGWSELHFQRPTDAEMTDRAFQSVVEESERMRLLVDKLAQLARAEGADQSHEPVDLSAICRQCVEDAALLESGATMQWLPSPTASVLGDPVALTQVVRNLLGNALLHAGPDVTVTVAVAQVAEGVEMIVADDGRGIPPALRDRVFDRFVTGDRRTGTGLGLAIVRAIVLSHGGTVELVSEPGAGTRVTVRLPAAPASA
ncbi:cell wall metabolism sensor histidine kinase WalK [Microbacterium sp. Bi128]|uniref:sensor histidine kinase n=1 Tax=Microbacterium sp. Bi128 TaxID=2821115 RepID=UPI001D9A102F|nr:HAMP domain-containing sensor histidine kinase [Microbacterium sp. Bi128]CAH0239018.1 putative sensor histidine kinase TcrY [Microbacterium sp. Bi128]